MKRKKVKSKKKRVKPATNNPKDIKIISYKKKPKK